LSCSVICEEGEFERVSLGAWLCLIYFYFHYIYDVQALHFKAGAEKQLQWIGLNEERERLKSEQLVKLNFHFEVKMPNSFSSHNLFGGLKEFLAFLNAFIVSTGSLNTVSKP
jgi:hypothetical protein